MKNMNFDSSWNSRREYPVNSGADIILERFHVVSFAPIEQGLEVTSRESRDGERLTVHLETADYGGQYLGGWFREHTAEHGKFGGRILDGIVHLRMNEECTVARGKWMGPNADGSKVIGGDWQLECVVAVR